MQDSQVLPKRGSHGDSQSVNGTNNEDGNEGKKSDGKQ